MEKDDRRMQIILNKLNYDSDNFINKRSTLYEIRSCPKKERKIKNIFHSGIF